MTSTKKATPRTCANGHVYYKISACETCPKCQALQAPTEGFLASLSSPARNALIHKGITTLSLLATYSLKDVQQLHGIGPSALRQLQQALKDAGLHFKQNK